MAVAYVEGTNAGAGFSHSITFSFTVSSSTNRALVLLGGSHRQNTSQTFDSATYAAVSLTAGAGGKEALGQGGKLFYQAAPPVGTANIVVNYSDGFSDDLCFPDCIVGVYSGVDQSTPVSGDTFASGNLAAPTATISSATGDLVVFLGGVNTQNFHTITASSPAVEDQQSAAKDKWIWHEAGASSVTIDGTISTSDSWWGVGLSLKAASAASTTTESTVVRHTGSGSLSTPGIFSMLFS